MIRHLCRLAWNCRGGYLLLGLEMLIAFLIIVVVATLALNNLSGFYQPLGFDYQDVWWVSLHPRSLARHQNSAADVVAMQEVERILQELEAVEAVAIDGAPPFSRSYSTRVGEYGGVRIFFEYSNVTDRLDEVLKLNLVAGRWFSEEDDGLAWEPVVITWKLARTFFGDADPLGKIITLPTSNANEMLRVVGVVDHRRYKSPFATEEPFLYGRVSWDRVDYVPRSFLVRLRPGTPRNFEKQIKKALSPVTRSWNLGVERLEEGREMSMREDIKLLIIGGTIAGLMLAMVALGLVGVLWQNVTQRTREIGVRRASGATRGRICAQFVGEVMVVATFAAVLGGMLIVQFAFFDLFPSVVPEVYIAGFLCAAGILYLLVSVAALYPGWLASRVQPVEALHYE
jgi:putative ABC transport system permease protein